MSSEPITPTKLLNGLDLQETPTPSPKKSPSPKSPRLKARVTKMAVDIDMPKASPSGSKEDRILERVKKCLDRGRHPATPEAEAKTALAMAASLMTQYNLDEGKIVYTDGLATENAKPGDSIVEIVSTNGQSKKLLLEAFAMQLASAMGEFFDCKALRLAHKTRHEFIFYGLPRNTVAAAMAFEMCYNLIHHWAAKQKGRSAKCSYRVGVSMGLAKMALEEKSARNVNHGMQLTLRNEKLEEDYRKNYGKLKMAKKSAEVKDFIAYRNGLQDSSKINVRTKSLK